MKRALLIELTMPLLVTLTVVLAFADDTFPLARAPFDAAQARKYQQQWAEHIGKPVVYANSIGMELVLIPPGEFTMGRTEKQFDKVLEAGKKAGLDPVRLATWEMLMMPAHRVRITKPFYLGMTEVTVAQFRAFCDATGYKTEAERGLNHGKPYRGGRPISTWRKPMAWIKLKQKDDEPVLHLCWNDCVAFCQWLTERESRSRLPDGTFQDDRESHLPDGTSQDDRKSRPAGGTHQYCLPTEAEWEYACRAGTTTAWSFGNFEDFDRLGDEYMFVSDGKQGKHDRPSRVAQKKPNPFGLYDMHGNVWEYVADWWHRYTYKNSPLNDPTGPPEQSEKGDMRRIIRASSFDWGRWGAQSVYRMRIAQRSTQHPHMGFRVAMRIQGVQGVPAAVDPDAKRRQRVRDPGEESNEVVSALKAGAAKIPSGEPNLSKELTVDVGTSVKMEFVLIPAGSFVMGSDQGGEDELPRHRVVISKPFYMAKYELTQSQWEAVMGKHQWLAQLTKGDNDMKGPTKAMNVLSWHDCQNIVHRLNESGASHSAAVFRNGVAGDFALPTEAQWEYACRAGSTTEFYFGNDASKMSEYAWYESNMNWPGKPGYRGNAFYHDVGRKKPNAFGLYDMHGGVWEWCADWYDADYYFDSPLVDPPGPTKGRFRVLRGGSWFRYPKYCRSAYRKFFFPEGSGDGVTAWINDFGCRLVINVGPVCRTGPHESEENREAQENSASKPGPARQAGPTGDVDYTKLARRLVRHPGNPVLKVGPKGAWNDQTLGCFSVIDTGDELFLYTGGAQYGKKKNVGMATSRDGIHWTYFEKNPLFPGSMPYAVEVEHEFRLYYPGGQAGVNGLLMRKSTDGFQWSPPTKVMSGCADPCIIQIAPTKFYLYHCLGGRKRKNGKQVWEFKNYVATSADGIHWKREPDPILPLGPEGRWDSRSHAGPVVLRLPDGLFHLWYLGSGPYHGKTAWRVGHATSTDGIHWTKSGAEPVLDVGPEGAWDGGTLMSFDIVFREKDQKLLFWYAASPGPHEDETKMMIQIGYGTSK